VKTKAFDLHSPYEASGDQPLAIQALTEGVLKGIKHQTLLGATGTGKTFAMAKIIANVQKPTLVLAHNKTLAAQLFSEFREFFPNNAVEYFVSYYDYYQPEAYIPRRDLFIEKDSDINETIERYRNAATQALLTRKDVIIVSSVSCIYGLGNPEDYTALSRHLKVGDKYERNKFIRHLIDMQYERSDFEFYTGNFRVRGDVVDVHLASEELAVRAEFFGDTIEKLTLINPVSGEIIDAPAEYPIFPAKQFVTPFERLKTIFPTIRQDLDKEVAAFEKGGRNIEAARLKQRVSFDLEMLEETGYSKGIENYSRYVDRRAPGSAPSTLLDYFSEDWLMFIDESHITVPQVRGMYNGDLARKTNLVDYGFRLRAALDNRPLKYEEFSQRTKQMIYVSATPTEYELELSKQSASQALEGNSIDYRGKAYTGVVEQIIRPTGLLDPVVELRPITVADFGNFKQSLKDNDYTDMPIMSEDSITDSQVLDLIKEIPRVIAKGQRILVTTLTKKMAEELTSYLVEKNIKARYLHSDIDTLERVEILRELRLGVYDVLVGINLLREGLDLPEVSLIAILDADKEGFLRSKTSLIQTAGRAARHLEGRVIMYADKVTASMKAAIDETRRRRKVQDDFNIANSITPKSIQKKISQDFKVELPEEEKQREKDTDILRKAESFKIMSKQEKSKFVKEIKLQMEMYADMMEFERAAELRDILKDIQSQ